MHRYIFPRTNKLTVFVITTVLYALACFIPELRSSVIGFFHTLWIFSVTEFHLASGFWQTTALVLGLIFSIFAGFFYAIGPLLLPFTKRDIRVVAIMVLWGDAALLIYWLVVGSAGPPLLRLAVILYVAAWMAYSAILFQMMRERAIGELVDDAQIEPGVAMATAVMGILIALTLVTVFQRWWLEAYMLSVFLCLFTERLWRHVRVSGVLPVNKT